MIRFEIDKAKNKSEFHCDGELSEILTDTSMALAHVALMLKEKQFSTSKAKELVTLVLQESFEIAAEFERQLSERHEE